MKKLIIFLLLVIFSIIYLTPDIGSWVKDPFQKSSIVFDSDGNPLHWQGPPYRNYVVLSEVPKTLIEAIRTTEDHRFFFHEGVDWIALTRAIKHLLATGRKDIGASTITMQLARNAFLSPEKTYSRKIKELIFAIKIDAVLSKNKILELYLNRIYLGKGAYGVATAAWRYYGRNMSQLSLAEQAMIAGLPQAPSKNNPIANRKSALKRRNFVLWKLYKHKIISQSSYNNAKKKPVTARIHKWPKNTKLAKMITKSNQKIYLIK